MKEYIVGGVVGICLMITGVTIYFLFNLSSRILTLESSVGQIVSFINNNVKPVPLASAK